jgi:hypothetical protein
VKVAAAVASLPVSILINLGARQVTDVETASLIAAAIPGVAFTGVEYMNRRRQAPGERLKAAVEGAYYKSPLLVAVYVVLALQATQAVIGFLVGLGIGVALSDYDLPADDVSTIAITASAIVVVPLVAVAIVFISRIAAYRIKERALAWLGLALLVNLALNLIQALVIVGPDDFALAPVDVIGLAILNVLYFGAVWVGVRWAQRTQALYVLAEAYRDLSPENRSALVELALPRVSREG